MSKQILTNLDFNNLTRPINLPNPVAPGDAANKGYVDSAIEGLSFKQGARVGSQTNITISSPGATIDGITLVSGDRVLLKNQTAASENGIYVWNGAASAMVRAFDALTFQDLEQAIISVEEGTDSNTTWRQTAVNGTIGTTAASFTPFGNATPAASTTTPGSIAIATQAEVDAGSVSNKAVTPQTLANKANQIKKFSAAIGDGSATLYAVAHNLSSNDVQVQVYRATSPFDSVEVDVERLSTSTVNVRFGSAPALNAYRVVVIG